MNHAQLKTNDGDDRNYCLNAQGPIGSTDCSAIRNDAAVTTIYKICERASWRTAEQAGTYRGSDADTRDGFIHFSTATQLAGTVEKYFARQSDLLIVAVDADALGSALKWERSRGGDLFPHLYAALPVAAVRWTRTLPDEADGRRRLPELKP
jgi:uncharacterized protein (DUF952 family)